MSPVPLEANSLAILTPAIRFASMSSSLMVVPSRPDPGEALTKGLKKSPARKVDPPIMPMSAARLRKSRRACRGISCLASVSACMDPKGVPFGKVLVAALFRFLCRSRQLIPYLTPTPQTIRCADIKMRPAGSCSCQKPSIAFPTQ